MSGGILTLRATTTATGPEAPRIARRCPGRANEQTRFSAACEGGRQRLHKRDPRERREQSDIAPAAWNYVAAAGAAGMPAAIVSASTAFWARAELGAEPSASVT